MIDINFEKFKQTLPKLYSSAQFRNLTYTYTQQLAKYLYIKAQPDINF